MITLNCELSCKRGKISVLDPLYVLEDIDSSFDFFLYLH